LTDEAAADLLAAFARFADRLRQPDVDATLAKELFSSTFVLCGLRHDPAQVANLYRSLSMTLEDSTTYQLILNKGVAQEAQRLLLLMGGNRFGAAPEATEATLRGITDQARLERMAVRIFDATGWDDLVSTQ
jgi:hypothetical protein